MKKTALALLLPLAGCAGQIHQVGPTLLQRVVADPSNACFAQVTSDPSLVQQIGQKMGLDNAPPTVEMLADKTYANAEQKAAISRLVAGRQQCVRVGAPYRQANLPPAITYALEDAAGSANFQMAKVYAGDMSFAEYNAFRVGLMNATVQRFREFDADQAQAVAAEEARQRATAARALRAVALALQAGGAVAQQQVRPAPSTTTTNCDIYYGTQVRCTSR